MGRRSPGRAGQWRPRLAVVLVLLAVPLLLFHRALLLGEAFVPADLLGFIAPWNAAPAPSRPEPGGAWNVLRYDGITQFYPWRLEAARQMQAGRLPLWNPYQFGAENGTPLLANSQSAPLYPLNVVFYLLPVWQAFGAGAALHLLIALTGTYRFLRALPLGRVPAVFGAVTFGLCGPVVTWLALPTFLAVASWLPWLLLLIRRAHTQAATPSGHLAALGAGGVAGMLLLAGHLQIAFYCLLAAGLFVLWHGARAWGPRRAQAFPVTTARPVRFWLWLVAVASAGGLAMALAAPQLLPALELGRFSHRAGAPSAAGYELYGQNALPLRNLVTLLVPDFFGHPNRGTYWNSVHYAEWAVYVGVLPLLLAVYVLASGSARGVPPERSFFAVLVLLALGMAMGTPINRVFFWGVPGWAQTGSPARSLLLVSFGLAVLAAMGLEVLTRQDEQTPRGRETLLLAIAVPCLLAAVGANAAARWAEQAVNRPWGELMVLPGIGLTRAVLLLVAAVALLAWLARRGGTRAGITVAGGCVFLTGLDLLAWGMGYNPTSPPRAVYPPTPGVRWLQTHAGRALIAPINRGWSLDARPPQAAVLPPNALTVYGLHDLSGYDSLFPAAAKNRVRTAGGGEDPSPLANGNLVFIKSVAAAKTLGARFLVAAPARGDLRNEDATLRLVYLGDDIAIYENREGRSWQAPARPYQPASFRLGLFLGLCGVATLSAALAATKGRRGAAAVGAQPPRT